MLSLVSPTLLRINQVLSYYKVQFGEDNQSVVLAFQCYHAQFGENKPTIYIAFIITIICHFGFTNTTRIPKVMVSIQSCPINMGENKPCTVIPIIYIISVYISVGE